MTPRRLEFEDPFLQKLMELRKEFDPLPWLELVSTTMQAGAQPGQQAKLARTPDYQLFFDQVPFVAWDPYYTFNYVDDGTFPLLSTATALYPLSSGAFKGFWSIGAQRSQMAEALGFVSTDNLHGTPENEWNRSHGGIRIKETKPGSWESWQETLQLLATIPYPAQITSPSLLYFIPDAISAFAGLRGYRLYPKGTIRPAQKTRAEYLAEGKRLEKYSYTGTVPVTFLPITGYIGPPAQGGATIPVLTPNFFLAQQSPGLVGTSQLRFGPPNYKPGDFLCHQMRVRPQRWDEDAFWLLDAIAVGVQPEIDSQPAMQSALFPWRMSVGAKYAAAAPTVRQQLRSQWQFPVPLTIQRNATWNLMAQPLISLAPFLGTSPSGPLSVTMEFIFDGELILDGP